MSNKRYIFIDESGDPEFFGTRGKLLVGEDGYQPLLNIGMIVTDNRRLLRRKIVELRALIQSDPLYNAAILRANNATWLPHARSDHPSIQTKIVEQLRNVDGYKGIVIIGRKSLNRFQTKHNRKPAEFYFDLVSHLLKNHLARDVDGYEIFLAQRQQNSMEAFTTAINKAIELSNKRRSSPIQISTRLHIVKSSEYPEMSVVDYMLWALQRYILKNEDRFFLAMEKKYSLIIDHYDTQNYKGGNNYYSQKNPFRLDKASPFI